MPDKITSEWILNCLKLRFNQDHTCGLSVGEILGDEIGRTARCTVTYNGERFILSLMKEGEVR